MKSKLQHTKLAAAYCQVLEPRMLLSDSSSLVLPEYAMADQNVGPGTLAAIVGTLLDNAPAGDPIYMKYGDIVGNVTDQGFQGDIQLNSFQWGVGRGISSPTGAGDRQASAPSVSEIVVTKLFDTSSSLPLIGQAFGGAPSHVEIDFVDKVNADTSFTYLKFELENTLISGYSMSSGGDVPSESLSLNFTRISVTANSFAAKGPPQTFTWDLAATKTALTHADAANLTSSGIDDPIYMKYGEINGDVTAKGFERDIELNSFQWGVGRAISSPTGGGADRQASAPSVSEIAVGKNFDSASVPLIKEAFVGTGAPVEIDFNNLNPDRPAPYLKIKLSDVLISSFSTSSGGDRPTESLSLNFTKISLASIGIKGETQNFTYDLTQKGNLQSASALAPKDSSDAAGGSDPIYMKYGDIKGDVATKGAEREIELSSFQWGVGRGISSPTGGSAGRQVSAPSVSEIAVGKNFDSASVPLIKEAFAGKPTPAEIDFVDVINGAAAPYLKINLSDALVSNFSMSSGGDRPTESLSLNFTKINIVSVGSKGETQSFAFDLTQKGNITSASVLPAQSSSASSAAPSSAAAVSGGTDPIYMKYGEIKGDVTTKAAQRAIELSSFQWGVGRGISSPTGAGGDRVVSAPSVSEIVVGKNFDSASVPLIQEAFAGTPTSAEIDFVNIGNGNQAKAYLKLTLADALISGYSLSSGGDRPTESLSLNFTRINFASFGTKGAAQNFSFDLSRSAGFIQAASAPAAPSAPATAAGSDPIYMKYGDIKGDVTTKGAEGEIEVTSFQWGVGRAISSPTGAGGNRVVSAPSVSEIVAGKNFDSASIPLIKEAFVGTPAPAEIDFANIVNGAAAPYLKITLSDVLISSFSMSSGGDRPTESLSLNFTKISLAAAGIKGVAQNFSFDRTQQKGNIQAASALPAQNSAASLDDPIYMKYGDIKGDVTTRGFERDIELGSFQWAVSRAISSPTGAAGREASAPSVSEIVVTKPFDSASVSLLREAFIGQPAPAEIDFVRFGQESAMTYLQIQLSDVLISGFSMSSGGDRPTESLSLNFTKITFSAMTAAGELQSFTWDLGKQVLV